MGTVNAPARATSSWLALREDADGRARSIDLVRQLVTVLPLQEPLVVHDLGAGTGSMGRWLAPSLSWPQRWVLHDRDGDLLAEAARKPATGADGAPVAVQTQRDDIAALSGLPGAGLITASALLDMLTPGELERITDICLAAHCPILITLTVTGGVELDPVDPLDEVIGEAFNAHQRRVAGSGRLLGPDAATAAAETLRRRGTDVIVRPSPWHLDAADAPLISQWLDGWVGAACEQDPRLSDDAEPYLRRRRAAASDGKLRVTVSHDDLLAVPR